MTESTGVERAASRDAQLEERARVGQCLARAFTLKQPGSFAGLLNAIDGTGPQLWREGDAGPSGQVHWKR